MSCGTPWEGKCAKARALKISDLWAINLVPVDSSIGVLG
jgi:hypothetical protein